MKKIVQLLTAGGLAAALPMAAIGAPLPGIVAPVQVEATVDLGDVQAKLEHMLNSMRQDDRCGSNWNIWDAKVLPNASSIKIDLNAR